MEREMSIEEKIESCPGPLLEIIEDFRAVPPRERLEYLLDFAMQMPDLPDWLQESKENMEQVHECQTPVFVYTELEGEGEEGRLHFYIDVPRESPTVRGYAAIVAEGLDNATPAEVLATPEDVHYLLGLHEAISPQRLRGLHALIPYLKRQAVAAMEAQ